MRLQWRDNVNNEVMLTMSGKPYAPWTTLRTVLGAAGLAALLSTGGVLAAEDGASEPRTAEASSNDDGEAPPPPTVRERREHGQIITEYERRGGVYLMTVKPRVGPTQYWNDPDGDGQFQNSTSDDIDESLNLPKWRLGGW